MKSQGQHPMNNFADHLNYEILQKFAMVMSTYHETTSFTIASPNVETLIGVLQIWSSRRVYGEDKKLRLYLQSVDPKSKDIVIKFFRNTPSIVLFIDGEQIKNNAIIKNDNSFYYEGSPDNMLIINKQNSSKYTGAVKSLTQLQPHGAGIKVDIISAKDQVVYRGNFQDGKKDGYGMEIKKNVQYMGDWKDNQKSGYGRECVRKRKKHIQKDNQSQKIQKSEEGKGEKKDDDLTNLQDQSKAKDDIGKFQEEGQQIKQKQEDQFDEKPKQAQIKSYSDFKKNSELTKQQVAELLKFNKSIYEGPFENGQKSGQGGVEFTKHGTYSGEWQGGMKNGKGTMKYKVGSEYVGEWKNNIQEGQGKYKDQAGNIYEGQFQGGNYDGQGKMTYVNGDVYEGKWMQGKKHGEGTYTYADGDYYSGEWVRDSAEGHGTSMINGIFFDGDFHKGMKEGCGEETDENGDVYKGIWKNNKRVEVISVNGELYTQNIS